MAPKTAPQSPALVSAVGVRPALRDLHRQKRLDLDRRVGGGAGDLLAGGVEPAEREAGLQALGGLPDEPQVGVAPGGEVRGGRAAPCPG
jgi:hypothetical protein